LRSASSFGCNGAERHLRSQLGDLGDYRLANAPKSLLISINVDMTGCRYKALKFFSGELPAGVANNAVDRVFPTMIPHPIALLRHLAMLPKPSNEKLCRRSTVDRAPLHLQRICSGGSS
jgi:hypothetical protein